MAPDRGESSLSQDSGNHSTAYRDITATDGHIDTKNTMVHSEPPLIEGRHFTFRGVMAGLLVGLIVCFSNMYFGLQTGWVSTMTMPSSLLGFGIFRVLMRHLKFPFSPVENVLVQTVAGSMAIMPLGCGFVGVLPAMNYLLTPEEQGPVQLGLGKLLLWSLGLCYFGVVFAVPLRRQVIIRERLRFPSGFSTAVLIGVLHGKTKSSSDTQDSSLAASGGFGSLVPAKRRESDGSAALRMRTSDIADSQRSSSGDISTPLLPPRDITPNADGGNSVVPLLVSFMLSGVYTLCTFFLPFLRNIPLFGPGAAATWLWTLNPSPAYVGQGVIMGPETTMHMLFGAIIGWGVLSPLAKGAGWAPGPVDNWETGSKGWIVWISLAIMLSDAVVSLGFLLAQTLWRYQAATRHSPWTKYWPQWLPLAPRGAPRYWGYSAVQTEDRNDVIEPPPLDVEGTNHGHMATERDSMPYDAPPDQQVGNLTVSIGLVLSVLLCIFAVHVAFGNLVPLYANTLAVLLALLLSIMGVRALGETDLNPVSGISKLAQLFFAVIVPQGHKASVLINLVAGAVSEAGALQAGELMQDLKTGHLLGAAPRAQFWGQVIGATVGAIASTFVYQLYTSVYTIPGDLFPVPTAYVWMFTARLVTGKGLPPFAKEWALGFGMVFAVLTLVRALIPLSSIGSKHGRTLLRSLIPGGIAVAVGMYNVPSFTLARTIGGVLSWYWKRRGWSNTSLIVLASGFILGEGVVSILNLVLESFQVPHW